MVAIIKKLKAQKSVSWNKNLCLKITKIACLIIKLYRSQERFRSYYHDKYTEEVNKIALSSNDDKRLQTPDRITTDPYGTSEMSMINK